MNNKNRNPGRQSREMLGKEPIRSGDGLGRGDVLAVESRPRNPGAGVRFLVSATAGRRSSALSTLNYCV